MTLKYDDETIEGFTAKCEKCGSMEIELCYEFNYYGGFTGYDMNAQLRCVNCEAVTDIPIL